VSLGVTAENPHFDHAGKIQLHVQYAISFKSVRNNLFTYSITFGESKVANWKDISNVFAVDRTREIETWLKTHKHTSGITGIFKDVWWRECVGS